MPCNDASEVTNCGYPRTASAKMCSMAAGDVSSFSAVIRARVCLEVANSEASVYISILEAFEL